MEQVVRPAVMAAPREIRIERLPLAAPRGGEVRVRLEGCGVCHSNLFALGGARMVPLPSAAGFSRA